MLMKADSLNTNLQPGKDIGGRAARREGWLAGGTLKKREIFKKNSPKSYKTKLTKEGLKAKIIMTVYIRKYRKHMV